MHSKSRIEKFKSDLEIDIDNFMDISRGKSEKAQNREILTVQPKESLSTLSKAKLVIKNYLGGSYFLAVDEIKLKEKFIYLIEGKHSKNFLLTSISDIKDGLLKMILYSNLSDLRISGKKLKKMPVLSLTSDKINGRILSNDNNKIFKNFISSNCLKSNQIEIIKKIFKEANYNNFLIEIKNPSC